MEQHLSRYPILSGKNCSQNYPAKKIRRTVFTHPKKKKPRTATPYRTTSPLTRPPPLSLLSRSLCLATIQNESTRHVYTQKVHRSSSGIAGIHTQSLHRLLKKKKTRAIVCSPTDENANKGDKRQAGGATAPRCIGIVCRINRSCDSTRSRSRARARVGRERSDCPVSTAYRQGAARVFSLSYGSFFATKPVNKGEK